ncbi:MAG: ATP synthase F1 subunit epsilon [Candidatus Gastranaerophilales bacterium]|nr:ATP synthase F1 subunit epsilon [Candidatus Gastranaerophilales bacterium]
MSGKKLNLKVITPLRILLETECDEVYSTAVDGEFGVLPGHIPMTTTLGVGYTKYVNNKEEKYLTTLGGIFQIDNDNVTILSDIAELGEEIDVTKANAEKQRAEALLAEQTSDEANYTVAQVSLAKALARLKVAMKTGIDINNM